MSKVGKGVLPKYGFPVDTVEDRLSAAEFFEDSPITQFEMPSSADVDVLNQLSEDT